MNIIILCFLIHIFPKNVRRSQQIRYYQPFFITNLFFYCEMMLQGFNVVCQTRPFLYCRYVYKICQLIKRNCIKVLKGTKILVEESNMVEPHFDILPKDPHQGTLIQGINNVFLNITVFAFATYSISETNFMVILGGKLFVHISYRYNFLLDILLLAEHALKCQNIPNGQYF